MMKHAIATVVLAGVVAAPAVAQRSIDRYAKPNQGSRYSAEAQNVPAGHLPPAGQCRVWYDGQPAGHQPAPTSCALAERVARGDRVARVVYGGPREDRFLSRSAAYEQGYKDGRDRGYDDSRDDGRYDPTQHGRYQAADHGYDARHGGRDEYRTIYRDGFRAGYAEGYRGVLTTRSGW
jgi:hypothetical protein